jgi:AraC-like DNA-binding protein
MYVMAGLSRAVFDAASHAGIDLSDVLAAHDVPASSLARADGWVPVEAHEQLWAEAARRLGRRDFAMWVAGTFPPGLTGVVEYILRSCSTVRDAAESWCRLAGLVSPCIEGAIRGDGRDMALVWRLERPASDGATQWAEFAQGRTVRLVREAAAQPDLAPKLVQFRHPIPVTGAVEHEAFFGCEVRFSQSEHATVWPAWVAEIPLKSVDPQMRAVLEERAAALRSAAPTPSVGDLVERAVRELLLAAPMKLTLDEIAQRCGLSARTLQRRLGRAGMSLRSIVDGVRRAEYARLRAHVPRAELAERLGFCDAAALHKAVRRWAAEDPTAE